MSLPEVFTSYLEYFQESLEFLQKYECLFNYANTDILVEDILNKIPSDWCSQYKKILDKSNEGNTFGCSEGSLYYILEKINRLTPNIKRCDAPNLSIVEMKEKQTPRRLLIGLNAKKQHEIYNLSRIINEECRKKNVKLIVDLGSGLGYLSQLLHDRYSFDVVGIEADASRLEGASNRQLKYHGTSKAHVHYVRHFVTAESGERIRKIALEMFPSSERFYLVGLHACADLTINAIKLFLGSGCCEGLVIMPCCYHKMDAEIADSLDKSQQQGFVNFPLSSSLKRVHGALDGRAFLRRPFLRLACQRAQAGWEQDGNDSRDATGNENKGVIQNARVFHLLSRAVLQLDAVKENAKLIKVKRRAVRKVASKKCDINTFIDDAITRGFILQKNDTIKCKNHLQDSCTCESKSHKTTPNTSYENKTSSELHKHEIASGRDSQEGERDIGSPARLESARQEAVVDEAPVHLTGEEAMERANKAKEINEQCFRNASAPPDVAQSKTNEAQRFRILQLWNGLKGEDFAKAEVLMFLQDSLQGFCENVVLLDKIAYLNELKESSGCTEFGFVQITDEKISPRCRALFARK